MQDTTTDHKLTKRQLDALADLTVRHGALLYRDARGNFAAVPDTLPTYSRATILRLREKGLVESVESAGKHGGVRATPAGWAVKAAALGAGDRRCSRGA